MIDHEGNGDTIAFLAGHTKLTGAETATAMLQRLASTVAEISDGDEMHENGHWWCDCKEFVFLHHH